jgi:CheY-like chemotaxis protein
MLAKNTKLLIVDDEPSTRLLLSQIFMARGFEVATAHDGFAALEQMREKVPDVILSDLNMPGMSGFEFLSVVRRRAPAIYVIASSGAFVGNNIPEGVAADAFYEKASGIVGLLEAVQTGERAWPVGTRNTAPLVPIWLPIEWQSAPGGLNHALSCPECLRIFAYTHGITPGQLQTETCVFCQSTIHFAVVKLLAAMSERSYHVELDAQIEVNPRESSIPQAGT